MDLYFKFGKQSLGSLSQFWIGSIEVSVITYMNVLKNS